MSYQMLQCTTTDMLCNVHTSIDTKVTVVLKLMLFYRLSSQPFAKFMIIWKF